LSSIFDDFEHLSLICQVPGTYIKLKWFKFEIIHHKSFFPKGTWQEGTMRTTQQYGQKADLALSMWVKLARASSTFGRLTGKDIERYGLTQPQFGVFEILGHLGPMTIGDVGKRMLVTGGCTTVILDNLEKEDLVERIRSTEDRRVIKVQLTEKGQRLFKEVFSQHAKRVTELASVLTEDEQSQLSQLLKKLGLALKEIQ
jgi:MarR family 2-MHQ and catechol resistance regulon transcriptional repressor